MIQYTDVPVSLRVTNFNHLSMNDIHVTFRQNNTVVDVTDVDVTEDLIQLVLTQEQTAQFREQPISVQVNFFTGEGQRKATKKAVIPVESNLLRRILHYGG